MPARVPEQKGLTVRFGLCCLFVNEPVRFRTVTARKLSTLQRPEQLAHASMICRKNSENLLLALRTAQRMGIGAFRILTPLFPRFTHPDVGYSLDELPAAAAIRELLREVRSFRDLHGMRLSFHPDQFVTLSSTSDQVVGKSVAELEYQGLLAELVGAEVINIHGGGKQGGKEEALKRLKMNFPLLSERVRNRLTLENDDVTYTVRDLLPVCEELGIPLVYDVHHHRCNPDGLTVAEATRLTVAAWQRFGREPWCHISSPKNGWAGKGRRPHADYIDPEDFPDCWRNLDMTIDVEAKAKELAVLRLMGDLGL
jgi:UV DNA damage endonuclease